MPSFDRKFNKKYLIGSQETRCRKFDPQKLFISIVHLIGGKNNEGYLHALSKTWDLFSDLKHMPVKSALSKCRNRISYEFFKDCFDQVILNYEFHRKTWRGLRVYATDGDRYELPRKENILAHNYRGYPFSRSEETYYPRMYVVHCYDVLGGVTKSFSYSNENDEVDLATEIATTLESQSLTLYDRLFLNKNLIRAHRSSGSFFLARCRFNSFKEIKNFFEDSLDNDSFELEGTRIELIKVRHPKTKEVFVYATNLPRSRFKNQEISELYALRWEVETSNRDLTATLKLEQWHSNFLNGILQELYATLWLANQTRIQMLVGEKKYCTLKELFNYKKPNFKLISDFIINSFADLVDKKSSRVHRRLKELIERSMERRKRRSRVLPRQVRRQKKLFLLASSAPRSVK